MENQQLGTEDHPSDDETGAFHVNKNGFPIDEKTWNRMWRYASKIYPHAKQDMDEIKNAGDLADIPMATLPVLTPQMPIDQALQLIQEFINSFSYNHTGTQMFEIKKSRPLAGLMDKAKEMIRETLPIKCLEAVILAIYLTNDLTNVERFPIGFKSVFNGHRYYHVVLGIYYGGVFGALGMSRRHDLMDKPLRFKNLHSLILDYETAYARYTHELKKVRVGGIVPHDIYSQERLHWGVIGVNLARTTYAERQQKFDQYTKGIKTHSSFAAPLFVKKEVYRSPTQSQRQCTVPDRVEDQKVDCNKSDGKPVRPITTSNYHVKV